jgi:hypothetical protein
MVTLGMVQHQARIVREGTGGLISTLIGIYQNRPGNR